MNLPYFIAKNISKGTKNSRLSKPIVQIAIIGIALGMAVMIITIFIVKGFQQEVRDRTVAFGSHIQITKYSNNNSLEPQPLKETQSFLNEIKSDKRIENIEQFATKNGIIKTKSENEGIVLKGIGLNYDWGFIGNHIIEGKVFDTNKQTDTRPILISKILSDRLEIKTGDKIFIYFILQKSIMEVRNLATDSILKTFTYYDEDTKDSIIQASKDLLTDTDTDTITTIKYDQSNKDFIVSGIYETGLEEYDKKMVFTQLKFVKKINHWQNNQIGGFEIKLKDYNEIDEIGDEIYTLVGQGITSQTIRQANPSIFMWLDMHDTTAWIVLILMVVVSVINMISALIILIIEKTNMIGILKALGMNNNQVKKIFMIQAAKLISKGMLYGNIFGVGIAIIQNYFHILKLNQATYYIPYVPIKFELLYLAVLNIGTFGICMLFMLLPAIIVTKTSPIKAIRFN